MLTESSNTIHSSAKEEAHGNNREEVHIMEVGARQVAYTFPEQYTGHAIYREAPHHLRDPFIEHIKQTSQPETFPGLYWGSLLKDEPFEIIHTFAIDRKKRPEGDYIPCPMCQRREKFLEGSFVFIFKRQCIAIIGHDCASSEVKHAAFSKRKRDEERRQHEDFLMARLMHVPGMLQKLQDLMPIASEIEGIFNSFKTGAPTIQKALRQVRRSGGDYILTELVDNEAALLNPRLPKKIARDSHFGSLRGEALGASKCKFVTDLRRYEQWLLPFDGCDAEEKALEATIGLLDRQEAAKAVQYIGEATRRIEGMTLEMATVLGFFSGKHIEELGAWARHHLQPMPFDVERRVRSDGTAVIVKGIVANSDREFARLFMRNELADWAEGNLR